MFLRSVLIAGAMIAAATPALAEAPEQAICSETTFRIYFRGDSAELDRAALQMMDIAERNVAGCARAELHVAIDASSPYAAERGAAILAAADGRAWDEARVTPSAMMRRASMGPDYAEVTMTPHPRAVAPTQRGSAGV